MPNPSKSQSAQELEELFKSHGKKKSQSGPDSAKAVKNCLANVLDKSKSARSRAEYLVLFINEIGYDLVEPVTALVERIDKQKELERKVAELTKAIKRIEAEEKARPLQPEIFLRSVLLNQLEAHLLLTQAGPMVVPVSEEVKERIGPIQCGDYVLVDRSTGTVVDKDGVISPAGEIVTVEHPQAGDGQAVVKFRDELTTAYVSDVVRADPEFCAGSQVVWDPLRRFLHRVVEDRADGSELLCPASELSEFTLDSLGSPHPILYKLLRLVKRLVRHPDWARRMKVRARASFLFYGPTGTGKTCTIKVLVNLVADWIGKLTGKRETRVVFCDAADFYSPYFGEAERKIVQWFKKLSRVARRELRTKTGEVMRVPLIVVFEEIEGLVRQRGEHGGSSHLFDRVLSLILRKMDDVKNDLDVPLLVISTTNMKSLIDGAGKRRFGQREARFGMLDARGAFAVLEKKIPADMEIRGELGEDAEAARDRVLKQVLYYLFSDDEDQVLARATLRDGRKVDVRRRDLVSGALLETGVSQAIDDCLDRSEDCGELLGLDTDSVIAALEEQLHGIATGMDSHNIGEVAPHLFAGAERHQIASVEPVTVPGFRLSRHAV